MNKISVIVCTYKPDFKKLKRTLLSIFRQEEVDVEIIISDDGSNVDYSEFKYWVQKYLPSNFSIKYLISKENKGIIKNYLAALELVNNTYFKTLSPGDYLNTEFALKKYYEKLEYGKYVACYSEAIHYYQNDDEFKVVNNKAPLLNTFKKKYKKSTVLKTLCLYQDYILGGAAAYKTEAYKKCLNELSECGLKHGEDFSLILLSLNGYQIGYIDEYLLWYESGCGVSTSGGAPLIENDKKLLYSVLYPKFKDNSIVKKSIDYHKYRLSHSKFKSYLHLFLLSPLLFAQYIIWLFKLKSIPKKINTPYSKEDYSKVFCSEN